MENPSTSCANNGFKTEKIGWSEGASNIIHNHDFSKGLDSWNSNGGVAFVVTSECCHPYGMPAALGDFPYVAVTKRTQGWHGIEQDITSTVFPGSTYIVEAQVGVSETFHGSSDVQATLQLEYSNSNPSHSFIVRKSVLNKCWEILKGTFSLSIMPSRVLFYLEGPSPGVDFFIKSVTVSSASDPECDVIYLEGPPLSTDLLLNSLIVKHAAKAPSSQPPVIENEGYGINIITNSILDGGTNGWFPLGDCTLSVKTGAPHIIPYMARESLKSHERLSGSYIHVTKRTQTWMGPAQMITEKVKLYMTYQVSAWVQMGPGATSPQHINIALEVDGQWANGGQVEVSDDKWHEIGGSFRIEKQPSKVMVYVQGPAAGIDVMVAGLQVFPVDRHLRIEHLKRQTDKVRKRDVILKFSGLNADSLRGTFVKVKQMQNSFPIGSWVSRLDIDDEDFVDFFAKNFNWAVLENELKWYWTESEQGNFNYKDADELLHFCSKFNIQPRGHCIFWEVEDMDKEWIHALSKGDLAKTVQNRLAGLLSHYKGKFKHYEVNNAMMSGSFYQDKLGKDIQASMFKTVNHLDPSALLFVNDYHVEVCRDSRLSPEKYIDQIRALQEKGAPVGGIGIQGHTDSPVGPIVCSVLDKLGILGLPIWFTELDVSSDNEYIRADDLQVMLREAFAHPAVEGIMLWGFMELFMSRENAHLVDAAGNVNEAGKRYLALKQEWLSHAEGHTNDQGYFGFRGFQGSYEVEIVDKSKKVTRTFVVDIGEGPLVLSIAL